jgi:archaetidylinositol phosphate synthase
MAISARRKLANPILEAPTTASDATLLQHSRKPRPSTELLCEWVFRPIAHLVVLALLPLRTPPPVVVCASATSGLSAAFAIGSGHFVVGALLLQLKTVLDNADGQLARASGRVTAFGRYLDSESDLLVNGAVAAALGYVTGEAELAVAAFLVLTLVLSVDFNLERLYRNERGETTDPMPEARGAGAVLARVYRVVYAPQDRGVEAWVERRLARLRADARARLAYHDRPTLAVIANLGLSTQLAALGVCLLAGRPTLYLWLVIACGLALIPLAARRELRARAASPIPA